MRSTDGTPIACQYVARIVAANDKVPSGITAIIGRPSQATESGLTMTTFAVSARTWRRICSWRERRVRPSPRRRT